MTSYPKTLVVGYWFVGHCYIISSDTGRSIYILTAEFFNAFCLQIFVDFTASSSVLHSMCNFLPFSMRILMAFRFICSGS